MPSRRQLLTALAVATAGCLGDQPATPPDGTDSTPPSDSPTPPTDSPADATTYALGESHQGPGGGTVTVASAAVHVSITSLHVTGSSAHPDVGVREDAQFLVADVEPHDLEAFGVTVDGERVERNVYEPFGPDDGLVAFEVPLADADSAAVVWTGGDDRVRWELPDDVVADLAVRPAFEVRRFEVADAVDAGDPIPVTLEVANVGDRDGRFLAELGAVVLSDVGEAWFDVPAGETVTEDLSLTPSIYTPMYGSSGDDLKVVLDWGADRLVRKVTVRSGSDSAS